MMRSTDRSSAVVFSVDSSTRICRRRPPLTLTAATPGTRSRRCASVFSAMSRSWTGVEVALDGEEEDRERRRVELEDDRRVGILGQPGADAIDAAADVVGRDVEVGAPGEVEADDRLDLRPTWR